LSLAGLRQLLLHFVMIKPTHYDDDGYPIQWFRSAIPSNTLAWMNALAEDARGRLGPDVEIRLHTYDETNRRVQPDRIIREIRKAGGKALIGLVGVQSNQFPRAVDHARPSFPGLRPMLTQDPEARHAIFTASLRPAILESHPNNFVARWLRTVPGTLKRYECVPAIFCRELFAIIKYQVQN
jgi:hypothetical protein